MLVSQMMDAVAMKYSAHKISFSEKNGKIRGVFEQYPLWLFENTSGKLRLLEREGQLADGAPLDEGEWLITCGDGLMTASSIAYIFKQLPLKDWLIYCERNGMPGIKAKTDAFPDSPQWEAACEAVADFGAEFHAVLSEGTDIEAIDVSTKGELPYPTLVERVDRMLCALWARQRPQHNQRRQQAGRERAVVRKLAHRGGRRRACRRHAQPLCGRAGNQACDGRRNAACEIQAETARLRNAQVRA